MAGEPSDDEPFAERPASDKLVGAVAKARVAEKLFARNRPVLVGRYHLLELVGTGGMGRVWGAWDPELERRVALKLVAAPKENARARILAEGQALAKLSHPNVVPIYDVGVVEDQVYLVMEWVRGKNLRAWCREPRSVRDIVTIYREAGAGLEAAHLAGLIHRDFKPDNAIVGDDGRVRVLDFGLARGDSGDEGGDGASTRGAGTPRYMAPEQTRGDALTAAVDQFAFAVSLREALVERGGSGTTADLPSWLDAIIARASAMVAADRFGSMTALLAALARDPRTVWRRRALVVAALGIAGGAFAIGTYRSDGIEPCSGGGADIARAWNKPLRARVESHLRDLGSYGADLATRVGHELDVYTRTWAEAHHDACSASRRNELPASRYQNVLACLASSRASLAAVADVLLTSKAALLPDAVLAARGLADPRGCRIASETSSVLPPSAMLAPRVEELANEVARARVLALAQDPRAIAVAETTARAATQLGYGPLAGRALLVHGFALMWKNRRTEAIEVLERAHTIAFGSGDGRTAIEAYARQIFAIATALGKLPPEAETSVAGAKVAESVARGLDPTGAFSRALLFNNLGTLRLSRGDTTGAREWFTAAMHERPAVVGETYELASIPGNLGLVTDGPAERSQLFAQERSELASVVGEEHPLTLDARAKGAAFATDRAFAYAELRDTCEQVQRLHPHLADRFSSIAYDLLWLAFDAGDAATVRTARAWVVDRFPHGELAAAYVLLLDERPTEASALAHAFLAGAAGTDQAWLRWRSLDALHIVALAEKRLGHRDAARTAIDRALAMAAELPSFANTLFYAERVARLRALREL